MSLAAGRENHAALMDATYRVQRHLYDATRKYYLFGRDRLIAGLAVPPDGSVLELGCGTGRNLIQVARLYPGARICGIDISTAMLDTAGKSVARHELEGRIRLAAGDATNFDAAALFGRTGFDRVFLSYTLSMIPDWQAALRAGLSALSPFGTLHIVDFGLQENHPRWAQAALRGWLARFHVEPRPDLRPVLEAEGRLDGRPVHTASLWGGYAVEGTIGARRAYS